MRQHSEFYFPPSLRLQQKNLNKGIYETRASLLCKFCPPVEPAPLWQMPKFQRRQEPHLETFRSPQARQEAFKSHGTDCTARTGVFGHGIYEGAKSYKSSHPSLSYGALEVPSDFLRSSWHILSQDDDDIPR